MNNMILKIIKASEEDLLKRKSGVSVVDLQKEISKLPKALDFYGAFSDLLRQLADGGGIIAEIKLVSPSAGELEKQENVSAIAGEYKAGGADAISIVTEKYFFKGKIDFIKQVKEKTGLPILQKDFVVDPYQIYESRISGADALLLIAKIISPDQLKKFVGIALKIGLEPVVEINDKTDLKNALQTNARVIAVNARDLDTFNVDVKKACELLRKIPDQYLKLGFSGVTSKDQVQEYTHAGANGVLVGTSLMKAEDRISFLKGLK